MLFFLIQLFLLLPSGLAVHGPKQSQDYMAYHQKSIIAETLITESKFAEALHLYQELFDEYNFVFLRDYKIASQLAFFINEQEKGIHYLKKGMESGWKLSNIRKNRFLKEQLGRNEAWKKLKKSYPPIRKHYHSTLNDSLRIVVKKMFGKDQLKALGALFTFSPKRRDRYAENKFGPHSQKQMESLIGILKIHGYPGERSIGNNFWMSTVLSHHNSISTAYVKKDSLYPLLRPLLLESMRRGDLSPGEFATFDEWYIAVKYSRDSIAYGVLNPPTADQLEHMGEVRVSIGLQPVEVRNGLIDVENETGMNFYLPGRSWIPGKIVVKESER